MADTSEGADKTQLGGVGAAPEPLMHIEPVPVQALFEPHDTGHPWQPVAWRLCAVEPAQPGAPLAIELHRDEASGYYLNVSSGDPSIFVMWRFENEQPKGRAVTLSYDEAGRWMDAGESVDRVGMAPEMLKWLADFVRLHYQPEQRRKRPQQRPSFMGRDEFGKMAAGESSGPAGSRRAP